MEVTHGSPDAAWSRLSVSAPVLQFLLVSGGFWFGALLLWELGRGDLAIVATGVGAAIPVILLWGTAPIQDRLWALPAPTSLERTESAVLRALGEGRGSRVDPGRLPRGSPLRRCAGVLRVWEPECLVGWAAPNFVTHPAMPPRGGTVLVLARGEGLELEALRGAIARSMATERGP